MIGAQGDEIPRVVVVVITIKVMNLNNQIPTTHATFTFMVYKTCSSVVFISLVVRIILSRPVKTIVTSGATCLLVGVFQGLTLRARCSKLGIFDAFKDMPREVWFCNLAFTMRTRNFRVYATFL